MLNGWTDADSAEFLAPMYESIARLEEGRQGRTILQRRAKAIEAWVAEHPNGIERELTD